MDTSKHTLSTSKPNSSLFDTDDLEENESLFKNNTINETIEEEDSGKNNAKISSTKRKNILFDPSALKSNELFNKRTETTNQENKIKKDLFQTSDNNIQDDINKESLTTKTLQDKVKSSFFDDDSEEDKLFQELNNINTKMNKNSSDLNSQNNVKKNTLFENSSDDEDYLFNTKSSNNKQVNIPKIHIDILAEKKDVAEKQQNLTVLDKNSVKDDHLKIGNY